MLPFIKQGYPVLANAAEEVEVPFTGLIASTSAVQNKRDVMRRSMAAVLQALDVLKTQKNKAVPILVKNFSLAPDDASRVYDQLLPGWSKDGKPTAEAVKFEFQHDQTDRKLASSPSEDQIYDFSLLKELVATRTVG